MPPLSLACLSSQNLGPGPALLTSRGAWAFVISHLNASLTASPVGRTVPHRPAEEPCQLGWPNGPEGQAMIGLIVFN